MALRVRVCKLADVVRDELRAFPVKGVTWPVIVTYVDDELVACAGVCPHEDVELADGDLFGHTIICPAHAYAFDLRTGACAHDRVARPPALPDHPRRRRDLGRPALVQAVEVGVGAAVEPAHRIEEPAVAVLGDHARGTACRRARRTQSATCGGGGRRARTA